MKRILAFFIAFAAIVSCEKINPSDQATGTITVTPSELVFGIEGGKDYLTLTLNSETKQWDLVQKDGADWCKVSAKSGRTSTTLTVTVPEFLGNPRTSVLEFTSPGCEPAVVTVTQKGITSAAVPAGAEPGINYNQDGTVTLVFRDRDADGKSHDYAYVIGEFSGWKENSDYIMNWDDAAGCWWYTMTDVNPGNEYMFQYYLGYKDQDGRGFADPYSEIIYEHYDRYITNTTYPGLPEYPKNASGAVSSFQVNRPSYTWSVPDYKIEDENDLVIYELHFRDFTETGDIKGAMKKLDYIQNLGVNAVELMPIHEFIGSDSWGYNPIAYFAFEKSYGTRQMYKEFIDECHKRGMAVIIDVVYNHAHEDHPMAGLYFDWKIYKPTANNPWFNVDAPHPHSVFHDFNHENAQVRSYVKQSLKYLIDEMNVDGFRFDLTKGFTQKKTGNDDTAASAYDASRVAILKDYCTYIKSVDPNAVVIFEHFADSENSEIAKFGGKIWRKGNWEFRNAVLGGSDSFSSIWTGSGDLFGSYVGFMESHDEERLCFEAVKDESGAAVSWGICGTITNWTSDITMTEDKPFFVAKGVTLSATDMFKIRGNKTWDDAYNYGASSKGYKLPKNAGYTLTLGSGSQDMAAPTGGTYDIYFSPDAGKVWMMEPGKRPADSEVPEVENEDALTVAMRRAGAAAAFCLTVPGPKMIWQFGELGYDESIEVNGRTGRKPLHWEYFDVPARKTLYDTYAGLLRFRKENPRFFDKDASFSWTPTGTIKTIRCTVDGKSFFVVGNFAKGTQTANVTLPSAGTWTNWFDSSETFTGTSHTIKLKGGEFKLLVK